MVGVVTVGHEAATTRRQSRKRRRPLSEVEHRESWGTPGRREPGP
jgi:hypothetical protein